MRKILMPATVTLGIALWSASATLAAPADGLVIGNAAGLGAVTEQVHWYGYWRHHHRHHHRYHRHWW